VGARAPAPTGPLGIELSQGVGGQARLPAISDGNDIFYGRMYLYGLRVFLGSSSFFMACIMAMASGDFE
jgi:hypothetical protein